MHGFTGPEGDGHEILIFGEAWNDTNLLTYSLLIIDYLIVELQCSLERAPMLHCMLQLLREI